VPVDEGPSALTLYYDPVIDYHHRRGPESGLGSALYLAPQRPEIGRALFTAAARKLGWYDAPEVREPLGNPRGTVLGLWLAREYDDETVYARLRRHAEAHHEPRWDHERGEFTWGYRLGEAHPRGQLNAASAAAEVATARAWWRIFNEPHLGKFAEPTVVGVEFPRVALRQAWWDRQARQLAIAVAPLARPSAAVTTTVFRVTGLEEPGRWSIVATTGQHQATCRAIDGELAVTVPLERAGYLIRSSGRPS
jgi:hypothetical protein